MSDEFEHTTIPVNGVRLHVVSAGPRNGKPLVLLHGFPEFWRAWSQQIGPLARSGFRVIVPDQRGYNLSETPKGVRAYSLDNLSADVTGLLDHFGYDTGALVGHDWGGAVAWQVALHYPRRITHLGILNIPHPAVMLKYLRRPEQMIKSWYIAFLQIPLLPDWLLRLRHFAGAANLLHASSKASTFSDDDISAYKQAWENSGGLTGMINWYRALVRYGPSSRPKPYLPMPVLILWGKHDIALRYEMAAASLDYCSRGELVTLENATHWVQHDEPERVNAALIDFLTR